MTSGEQEQELLLRADGWVTVKVALIMLVRYRQVALVAGVLASAVCCHSGEIHEAVANGSLRKVKALLEADPKLLQATNEFGSTPLHDAAYRFRPEMLAFLLEKKPDLEALDSWESKPLHMAVFQKEEGAVKMLLEAGARVDAKAVTWAAEYGDVPVLRLLLDHGGAVDARDSAQETAMIRAAAKGHREAVDFLLARGASLEAGDANGSTALICASSDNHTNVLSLLLEKGANINAVNEYGLTALLLAAQNGRTNTAEFLLEHKADVDLEDAHGLTALGWCLRHPRERQSEAMAALLRKYGATKTGSNIKRTRIYEAARTGDMERVKVLLKERPELANTRDNDFGGFPLHHAVIGRHMAIAELLIGAGADVNARDFGGATPLHEAARVGNLEMVKLLVAKKADIKAKDSEGRTVLHQAVFSRSQPLVEFLIERGLDVNAKAKNGLTPLDLANALGPRSLAQFLETKKSDK